MWERTWCSPATLGGHQVRPFEKYAFDDKWF
jgi:hypothetical protein